MNLQALIDTLETNIERAEDDSWTVLCLQVPEAEVLLREMIAAREEIQTLKEAK